MSVYSLSIVQQPMHARMCGFGERADKRPIDPPPILRLDADDVELLNNPYLVVHVALLDAHGNKECNLIQDGPKLTRIMMGSLITNGLVIHDTDSRGIPSTKAYFAFPDLSIRTEGTFTLMFSLALLNDNPQANERISIIQKLCSKTFKVYTAKQFPGMSESSDLTRLLANQGLKIPVRNERRPTRKEKRSDEEEERPEESGSEVAGSSYTVSSTSSPVLRRAQTKKTKIV